MSSIESGRLLDRVVEIAVRAGREILDVYETRAMSIDYKGDGSPLTAADMRSHRVIESSLRELRPELPVLSEESSAGTLEERGRWSTFWLVDPLDGTKEFIKGNGEFTVNIALIHDRRPVLGVVHTPVRSLSHYAAEDVGAFRREGVGEPEAIRARALSGAGLVAVVSRSHRGGRLQAYLDNVERRFGPVETVAMGSSLKICLVAEGAADIYPRLGPTSEWDTAAAQCVLEVAGGKMLDAEGIPLEYNKPDILNPWFFASGNSEVDWAGFLAGLD